MRVVGDGLFIEFGSAIDALRWADGLKRELADGARSQPDERLALRIGINVDDVLVDEDELHGDGVNVAARIHQMAAPGDIVVTSAVRDYALNRIDLQFEDLGEHWLKNISHPVRVCKVGEPLTSRRAPTLPYPPGAPVPRRLPAVAVLPFRNIGGPPEDDYFGEGMTEDIITALSRSRSFAVIARASTLRYASETPDVSQAARELGVQYLLLGSVRRQSGRLRISARLIDERRQMTLWANNFDGGDDELFAFQDRIASSIVSIIEPRLLDAESGSVATKPTDSLDAYDCVLRSLPLMQRLDHAHWGDAAGFLDRALQLDPFFAQAHAHRAWLHLLRIGEGLSGDVAAESQRARVLVDRAMLLDDQDALVMAVAAHVYSFLLSQPERALGLVRRAVELNENSAFAWAIGCLTHAYLADCDAALHHFEQARRLSPFDPMNHFILIGAALAEFARCDYAKAEDWARQALRWNPRFAATYRLLIACLAHLGRLDEARALGTEVMVIHPGFRISAFEAWYPMRPLANLKRYADGLRMAGLPD